MRLRSERSRTADPSRRFLHREPGGARSCWLGKLIQEGEMPAAAAPQPPPVCIVTDRRRKGAHFTGNPVRVLAAEDEMSFPMSVF